MQIINIHEAKTHLSRLLELAVAGESIVIAKAGKPMVRLEPYRETRTPRKGGQLKGKIRVSSDFDTCLPSDIAEAFGIEENE